LYDLAVRLNWTMICCDYRRTRSVFEFFPNMWLGEGAGQKLQIKGMRESHFLVSKIHSQ
jgi:hypothetical protein